MSDRPMILTGDDNVPAMPMTEAQVNHLRRLLAWMRCEWALDESVPRVTVEVATELVKAGAVTPEAASQHIAERAAQINRVPIYVRQAVKMLTKALREHERAAGVVEQDAPLADLVERITPENCHPLIEG